MQPKATLCSTGNIISTGNPYLPVLPNLRYFFEMFLQNFNTCSILYLILQILILIVNMLFMKVKLFIPSLIINLSRIVNISIPRKMFQI